MAIAPARSKPPIRRAVKARRRPGRAVAGLVLAVVVVVAGGAWLASHPAELSGVEVIERQMLDWNAGPGPDRHIFGGRLSAITRRGHRLIVADDVPPEVCVSLAVRLSRRGVVSIGDVTPQRVSASRVSQLCHGEKSPQIAWEPREEGADDRGK